jgi:hypothetical protein
VERCKVSKLGGSFSALGVLLLIEWLAVGIWGQIAQMLRNPKAPKPKSENLPGYNHAPCNHFTKVPYPPNISWLLLLPTIKTVTRS